jgi:hypothetical protein
MPVQKFMKWHQKMLLGASLKVTVPTGQYDPTKLINCGANRWGRSFESHLTYDFKPRLWASLDGNYWFGGKTSVNGVQNPLPQESSSCLGGTVSVPISRHQSLKFNYNNGTYIRFGGNYQSLSAA